MFKDFSRAGYAGHNYFNGLYQSASWRQNPLGKIGTGLLSDTSRQVGIVYDGSASAKNRAVAGASLGVNFIPTGKSAGTVASKIEWGALWTPGRAGTVVNNLAQHFANHGTGLGFSTIRQYQQGAKDFLAEAASKGYSATIDSNKVVRVWDGVNKKFGSYVYKNNTFTPATFFKADSGNYWRNQMATHSGQSLLNLSKLIK